MSTEEHLNSKRMKNEKIYILNHVKGAFQMADHWMHPKGEAMTPAPSGEYVKLDDYAVLKSDAQLVVKHLGEACAENARLKAEVERLTKLCQAASPDGFIHIRDINSAKDGKPSDDDEDNRNRGGFNPRK